MKTFFEMLDERWDASARVCIGLDSELSKLPKAVASTNPFASLRRFNRDIVQATKSLALAYKPNIAFYPGADGLEALRDTVQMIRETAPGVPVILDAKRADIGNTNRGYAAEAFDIIGADAVTVNPYFGREAMKPFLERTDKGIFVLCRTSNPGADEFQDAIVGLTDNERHLISARPGYEHLQFKRQLPLYQYVALHVACFWNENGNCGLVAGATRPRELAEIRRLAGDLPILAPGVGAQGGSAEETVRNGLNRRGRGLIVNSSSGIIFASRDADYAEAAYREAHKLTLQINGARQPHAVDLKA